MATKSAQKISKSGGGFDDILVDKKTASTTVQQPLTAAAPYAVTGTTLQATIVAESWDSPGTMETLVCGSFEIDGITLDGPPATATIKAVSVPLNSSIRREAKSRAWEDTTLRSIAADVATIGGINLSYMLDDDPRLDRVDQRQEADLPFLARLCNDHGATLKVIGNHIVIFDEAVQEATEPVVVIKKGDSRLLSYSFTQDSSDTASEATVVYKDPSTGKLVEETFSPPEPPAVGQALVVNARPSNMPKG